MLPYGRLAAEFTVIVVGVLVALFTESAWQERGERAEEVEVLDRIAAEVRDDSLIVHQTGIWLDFVVPAVERVPEILAGRDTLAVEAQLAILYAAATARWPRDSFWSWDELRQTGRTGLIRDRALRGQLARDFGVVGRFEESLSELPDTYRAAILGILPSEYTTRVLRRCVRNEEGQAPLAPRTDAFEYLTVCPEAPGVDPEGLLASVRAQPGLRIEAGRLAYELARLRETHETLRATRDSTAAMLDAR